MHASATSAPARGTFTSSGALVARDLAHSYGDRVVLDGVSFAAAPGRRLGLVGDNGTGKSTLLRLLAGLEPAAAGAVVRPPDTALLEQELSRPPATTIHEVVEEALAELREATRQVEALGALVQACPGDAALAREYGDRLEWAQAREAWDADHRVDRVLRGLGLERYRRSRPIGELSGGERARVAMAALLVRQPRALLLDEATNHLDDAGLAFLEAHLVSLPGVVVVSSHDRTFLDAVCTEVLDLDPARGGPTRYSGAFSEYQAAKRAERRRWEQAWAERQEELRALRETLTGSARQVGKGRRARDNDKAAHNFRGARVQRGVESRVRSAHKRMELLERKPLSRPPDPLRFTARIGSPLVGHAPVVYARDASVRGRLAPVSLSVAPGEQLLLTGANGAGKSTLLELLAGAQEPHGGAVSRRPRLRVGLLEQDVRFGDPDESAAAFYARRAGAQAAVVPLADLGLVAGRDLHRRVSVLSEGQRRRLMLAVLVADAPHLLLLDEPTNHLSPLLVGELEDALSDAPCAVVVASHDRWLRARWTSPQLELTPIFQHANGPR